jgi:hypothetical protein
MLKLWRVRYVNASSLERKGTTIHRHEEGVVPCYREYRWLPTAAARIRARSGHVGIVVDKVALEQVSSEYFGFPCQSSFHQILDPHNQPGQVQ